MLNIQRLIRAAILPLNYPVFDRVPHNETGASLIKPPYIVIGNDNYSNADNDDENAYYADCEISVYTLDKKGKSGAMDILDQIETALSNKCLSSIFFINSKSVADKSDGSGAIGTITAHAYIS